MKKHLIIIAAALALLCSSCVKEKNCRCTVQNSQNVRIITIKKGNCAKINTYSYFDALDTMHTDVVFCTDYPFEADTAIVYN